MTQLGRCRGKKRRLSPSFVRERESNAYFKRYRRTNPCSSSLYILVRRTLTGHHPGPEKQGRKSVPTMEQKTRPRDVLAGTWTGVQELEGELRDYALQRNRSLKIPHQSIPKHLPATNLIVGVHDRHQGCPRVIHCVDHCLRANPPFRIHHHHCDVQLS